jgi:hypothetical protein
MFTIKILHQLWNRRRLLAVAGLVAVLAGFAIMFQLPSLKPRSYTVGMATGQILLDTPDSQVVTLSPKGSESLGLRASVIASLMVGGEVESAIARQAGLKPSQLGGSTQAATEGSATFGSGTPVPARTPSGPDAYILTTQTLTDTTNNPLPIVAFTAEGPNAAAALRLANATITGLRNYLNTKAATERIPDAGRLQVTGVGVPQVTSESRGPTLPVAIIAVIMVFAVGCAAIVGFPMLRRSWRVAGELEKREGEPAIASDSAPGVGGLRAATPDADTVSPGGSSGTARLASDERLAPASRTGAAPTPRRFILRNEDKAQLSPVDVQYPPPPEHSPEATPDRLASSSLRSATSG